MSDTNMPDEIWYNSDGEFGQVMGWLVRINGVSRPIDKNKHYPLRTPTQAVDKDRLLDMMAEMLEKCSSHTSRTEKILKAECKDVLKEYESLKK